ncbi:hypothetical protein QBC40DRAFT_3547 [Triangularia verruculosa]|uniref:BZIP domain-containing protein n=1 Tax=Triangularia verruculosa TaxID=2587418 RepID=A0AAN6XPJ5_9PEZI|nr:hypothetical protein QBC40DRAFT_3547 [Triangularia verruculosa]
MSSADDKKQAELGRIRKNQRLSRARRKEYVASLEARVREYEERGVQASLEIQLAARKVAEENEKLRELLGKVGVGEASVREYLQQQPACDGVAVAAPCISKEQPNVREKDDEPNGCPMATDLISLITGASKNQVRVTLGCIPGSNCDVDEEAIEKTITRLKGSVSS